MKSRSTRAHRSTGGKSPAARTTPVALPRLPFALAPLLAAIAAVVLRSGSLRAPFFADDWLFLDQARTRSLWGTFASADPIGNFFRPLGRQAWFWLLGHASGESPAFFHAANLLLIAASVLLLGAIARRAAGPRAAAIASAFLALHYAADVPVLWAAGSQDLLATALALGAILLAMRDRLPAAALMLLIAPLAKEPAAVAIVPALLLARRAGESWPALLRRAWALPLATLAWLAVALAAAAQRPAPAAALSLGAWGLPAALVGAIRVALGIEWRTVPGAAAPLVGSPAIVLALALAAGAVLWAWGSAPAASREGQRSGSPWPGSHAWVVAAALPVAFVAPIWSAYFYLFAMAGVALALGTLLGRAPAGWAVAAVLALGLASQRARTIEEFATAPSPWSAQSHVNARYLERGMQVVTRCVDDLRASHATLAPRTTVFFAGLPSFAAVQVGDGPLLRGVYRDSSLRSYFITRLRRDLAGRGPVLFMIWDRDEGRLIDRTAVPHLGTSLAVGFMLDDELEAADAALAMVREQSPGDPTALYALGLVSAARGDSALARRQLVDAGYAWRRSGPGAGAGIRRRFAAGDTAGARELGLASLRAAVLDADAHLALAEVMRASPGLVPAAMIEAFAARALAPNDASAWRYWAGLQLAYARNPEAARSLERYFALDPGARTRDLEANEWGREIRRRLPGGAGMQAYVREAADGR